MSAGRICSSQSHPPAEQSRGSTAGSQAACSLWGLVCGRPGRCSISKESARGAWLPHGPPKPAPSPQLGEFWGLVLYRGWEVFQGGISSPPPQASPQLSLKTEKFVLVFLLLLSSYEMSPTTESLNKFRLLEQHLIQLLSSFHHNFKPLIY